MAKKTGKAGNMTVAGTVVPITKWACKSSKELHKSTDSANYNAGDGQLYKSQLPGEVGAEGTIEFNFDTTVTPTTLIDCIHSDTVKALVLKLDAATTLFSFDADLADVDIDVDINGMATGSATFQSNGVITT